MRKYLILLGLALMAESLSAQSYISLYNFDHVNQNLMVNPASNHKYRFVLGIPGLSGANLYVHGPNNMASILEPGSDANKNFENFLNNLSGKERLNLNQSLDVLYVGFGTKKGYFSLGAQEVTNVNMTFPGELMRFLYYGNVGSGYLGQTMDMSGFDLSVTSRVNYHIGYQHEINDKLTIGGRYKYISGVANVNIKRFNASIYSDVDKAVISTDILIQTSGLGLADDLSTDNLTELVTGKNSGMAFDFGFTYKISEKFDVSASLIDFGWINWKKDLKGYTSQGEYEFTGVDYNYAPNSSVKFGDLLENNLDSLSDALEFTDTTINSYKTSLPSHVMGSFQFHVTPKHVFSAVYQGTIWNTRMYHSYGIQYIGKWANAINFMAGYSVLDNSNNNLSLGLSLRLGAFQIYALTDNVWGVIEPTSIAATSVRLGINLSFVEKPKILE